MTRILVVDNYDSFVYNLVQYLASSVPRSRSGATTTRASPARTGCRASTDPAVAGPGTPERAACASTSSAGTGEAADLRRLPRSPVHGCAYACGRSRSRAAHGKTSEVFHNGTGVFAGLPSPLRATRYHRSRSCPSRCRATRRDGLDADGVIMAYGTSGSPSICTVPPRVRPHRGGLPDARHLARGVR